jgi:YedE family putative selenium metabolism protein
MRKDTLIIIIAGIVVGVAALVLVGAGNPKNMGFCIACFERDIAGALGLHDFKKSAWIRPEIIGIILGAMIASFIWKEFKPEGGSSPATRFLLGMFVMIGALVFLGCPLRMILRLGGGDLNAVVALTGFIAGIGGAVLFLKSGFNLGRAQKLGRPEALIFPAIAILLLLLVIFLPTFKEGGPVHVGPGGHPGAGDKPVVGLGLGILISLIAGLAVGIISQRSRLCLAGGVRDMILIRSPHLLTGFIAIFAVVIAGNLIFGNFKLGFEGQPVAHTGHVWNFLGMGLVGAASVLLGGCPLRQLILAGRGNTDSAITVLGMAVGAAFAHNFGLVKAASGYGKAAVFAGLGLCVVFGLINREKSAV